MVTGLKFANLGPFKLVSEPVTFQCLCACLCACERGKTAHASGRFVQSGTLEAGREVEASEEG